MAMSAKVTRYRSDNNAVLQLNSNAAATGDVDFERRVESMIAEDTIPAGKRRRLAIMAFPRRVRQAQDRQKRSLRLIGEAKEMTRSVQVNS